MVAGLWLCTVTGMKQVNVVDKADDVVVARAPLRQRWQTMEGITMAKIDLDSLNIEELIALRERISEKITEKVAARQAELEAELAKLSQYGKPGKKAPAAPVAKAKKKDEPEQKSDEPLAPNEPPAGEAEAA
jgi:hypothetical protein